MDIKKFGRRVALFGGGAAVIGTASLFSPAIMPNVINTYSSGWRLGELNKFSLRGLMVSTAEGDLMLGKDSSRRVETINGVQTVLNPWSFSASTDIFESYRARASALRGQMVAVRYRQVFLRPIAFTYETDYIVDDIRPAEPTLATAYSVPGFHPNESSGRSDGDRVGRIVKVTEKGILFKTWEATIQVGNAGNEFIDVSILDEGMFAAATRALQSGRRYNFFYGVSLVRNPLARDTRYELRMIEPMPAPAAT
jgi:hypothetical protein